MKLPFLALVLLWAVGALLAGACYPQLPARVASHFDAAGNPNGFSSPGSFVAMHLAITALVAGVFGGIALWLPSVPASMVNLPNREYWLAAERRDASMRWMSRHLIVFACTMLAFLQVVFALSYRANLPAPTRLAPSLMWGSIVAMLVFTAWFLVSIYRRFSAPRAG